MILVSIVPIIHVLVVVILRAIAVAPPNRWNSTSHNTGSLQFARIAVGRYSNMSTVVIITASLRRVCGRANYRRVPENVAHHSPVDLYK